MHDLRLLRENLDVVRARLGPRGDDVPWEELAKLLEERRNLTAKVDELRHQLRTGSSEVARLKREKQPADEAMAMMKAIGNRISDMEAQARTLEERVTELTMGIPNLPHASVPAGDDASNNQEVRRWGQAPEMNFTPQPHWEIGEALGIVDFERATKIAGARFVVMKGLGARLERALINYMLDLHTGRHGYHEMIPPFMVNRAAMTGTGQLPKFETDLFHLGDDDFFLIPTAEVPLTNLLRDEILPDDRLPIRYTAYTPCFRREAGSYGKDTRGLIRLHQFNKVELVAFVRPDESYAQLESLTTAAEAVLQGLGLPYRVMALCTGDLGFSAAKTYDLEVWLPGQGHFREISSCSNFEGFQARRANIRYRRSGGKTGDGKTDYVHTLNGSGLAVGRTLVAILENYQQADGSVLIPESLRPYLGGLDRLTKQT